MLTKEVMGIASLAILWINVLLIAAAAAKQVAALLDLRAALPEAKVVRGRVARGDGPDGAIAAHRIEQLGRAADGGGVIVFHDRSAASELFGGEVTAADGVEIAVAPGASAEVWLAGEALERAGECASAAAFDAAHALARKAQGFPRTVSAPLREGDEVFVSAREGRGLLLATMDPRALLARKAAIGVAFVVAELLAGAGCTALALQRPFFGAVSTAGGALCLALFLLGPPVGTAVRDALLVPSRAIVRGRWSRAA
jgi:hypothetical protein